MVKTQPRHKLNSWQCHRCPCDPSGFLHLSCKRGKQYVILPFLSLFCVFNLSEEELSCYDKHNKATATKVHPKGRQLIRLLCPWRTRAITLCQVGLLIAGDTKRSICHFGTERGPMTGVHSPVLTAETVGHFKGI